MTIVCLGWGSLIWDQRELPVIGGWQNDGPTLRLEFARQSKDDRITLVTTPDGLPSVTCWAALDVPSLVAAIERLAEREETDVQNIGRFTHDAQRDDDTTQQVSAWAKNRQFEGVVWTALPPRWAKKSGVSPTLDQAVSHLRGLTGLKRERAAEYILNAPRQIETRFRPTLQAEAQRMANPK